MDLHFLENPKVPRYDIFIGKGFLLGLIGMDHSNSRKTVFLWPCPAAWWGSSPSNSSPVSPENPREVSWLLYFLATVLWGSVFWKTHCASRTGLHGLPVIPWYQPSPHLCHCLSSPHRGRLEGDLSPSLFSWAHHSARNVVGDQKIFVG